MFTIDFFKEHKDVIETYYKQSDLNLETYVKRGELAKHINGLLSMFLETTVSAQEKEHAIYEYIKPYLGIDMLDIDVNLVYPCSVRMALNEIKLSTLRYVLHNKFYEHLKQLI